MRIAGAGAGFHLDPFGRTTDELVRIAGAAKNGGATLTIIGTFGRTHE